MRLAIVLLCAACESTPPTCERAVANGTKYIEIDSLVDREDEAAMEQLVPFDRSYTGSDVAYLVGRCAEWSVSYRRCIATVSSQLEFVECNQADKTLSGMDWSALPHVAAWLQTLSDMAGDAFVVASSAATDAAATVDDLERKLGELDAASPGRAALGAKLAAAKSSAAAAKALETECELRPLVKPACLALLHPL
ncbi:MAG TPA: hypothetical protein VH143_00325 [Kofleriaceae bacterium]|jgi:hypothetical protein|nr:hypothetical protein [Kofleriaceae bacterium]